PVAHVDQLVQTRCAGEFAVALVLSFAQVHAGDLAALVPGQPSCGAAVAGTGVDDFTIRSQVPKAGCHRRHGTLRRRCDRLILALVETDVDVLAAPDMKVEVVGVATVV